MALSLPMDARPFFLGNKSVTHRIYISQGVYVNYDYTGVSVREVKLQEVVRSNGIYLRGDRRFGFSRSTVEEDPKLLDIIVYDQKNYTVVDGSTGTLHDHVKVTARDFRLAYGLTDEVTIVRRKKLGYTDTAGRAIFERQVIAANVVARVQIVDREFSRTHDINDLDKMYSVFLESYPAELDSDCIVELPDGRILEIESITDLDALAVLPTLTCRDNKARWN